MQVRKDTAKLGHVRQLLYDYLRAGKAWRAPRTEETVETNSSNVVPMDVEALHREGGKSKTSKGKGKLKGDRNKNDAKGKGKQTGKKNRHFDGYCNQCGEYGHMKADCAGRGAFFQWHVQQVRSTCSPESGLSCENDGAPCVGISDRAVRGASLNRIFGVALCTGTPR